MKILLTSLIAWSLLSFSLWAQEGEEPVLLSPEQRYNEGVEAFQKGEFDKAAELFSESLRSRNLSLQEKAYYNLGSVWYELGKLAVAQQPAAGKELWQQAVDALQNAMDLNAENENAAHNQKIIQELLDQLQEQEPQKEDQPQDSEQEEQNSEEQDQEQSQESSSEKNDSSAGQENKPSEDSQNDGSQQEGDSSQEQSESSSQQESPSDSKEQEGSSSENSSDENDSSEEMNGQSGEEENEPSDSDAARPDDSSEEEGTEPSETSAGKENEGSPETSEEKGAAVAEGETRELTEEELKKQEAEMLLRMLEQAPQKQMSLREFLGGKKQRNQEPQKNW